ncbi:hypothetical protein [Streptomyces sp. SYSU K21746]
MITNDDGTVGQERPYRLADLVDSLSPSPGEADPANRPECGSHHGGFADQWRLLRAAATERSATKQQTPDLPATSAVREGDRAASSREHGSVAANAREVVLERIALFRSAIVMVPLDERGSPWSAEQGDVRWILAFSSETTMAQFALARCDGAREWGFRTVSGARLLDDVVPAVTVPCGVALDPGCEEGMLFPPVVGIVPDSAAVDLDNEGVS